MLFTTYKVRAEKALEKLIYQNSKMMTKLDTLISVQKNLDERVSKIEKLVDSNNTNNNNNNLDDAMLAVFILHE